MTTDVGALLDQAYMQGRREAADEIADALKLRRDEARADEQRGWPLLTEAAVIARNIGSQPPQPVSNGLAASSRHPGTPEDTKPPQEAL